MRSRYFLSALLISVTQTLPQFEGNALKLRDNIQANEILKAANTIDTTADENYEPQSPSHDYDVDTWSTDKEEKTPKLIQASPGSSVNNKQPSGSIPLPGLSLHQTHTSVPYAVCQGTPDTCQICRSENSCIKGQIQHGAGIDWLVPLPGNTNPDFGQIPLHEEDE